MLFAWGKGSLQASEDPQADPDAGQDPHPGGKEERSGLRGPCKECHQTYIGETAQGETQRAQAGGETWRPKERHRGPCP